MTSSETAFAIFIAKHNLPMAVGDEFGLLAKKMWCSTVPVAHPGGEKNTNYRFSSFFVWAVHAFSFVDVDNDTYGRTVKQHKHFVFFKALKLRQYPVIVIHTNYMLHLCTTLQYNHNI